MDDFKILLVDDDYEQREQLQETIDNYNKKLFIEELRNRSVIDDEKYISKLMMLENKEAVYKKLQEDGKISDEFDKLNKIEISFEVATTPEEAAIALFQNNFEAVIVDLMLVPQKDIGEDDEQISGNILLKNIIDREIIPIIVRTGFSQKISEYVDTNIIKVQSKDESSFEDVISELINCYEDSIFRLLGSRGKVNNNIKVFFWEIIPECFSNKKEELMELNKETQEFVLIRYISSWLSNRFMFNEKYLDVEPIEMYMFPNPITQVCSCDIYEDCDNKQKFLVLTPACDLANSKTNEILFAKIKKYDEVQDFSDILEKCLNKDGNEISNKNKNKIAQWSRNSDQRSMRYHFLPKVSFFEGGFIDFRSLITLEYDYEKNQFKDRNLKKLGVITDVFKRDIIARFSSYYHRQGQPSFNTESILNKLLED